MSADILKETRKVENYAIPVNSKDAQEILIEAIENGNTEAIKDAIKLATRAVEPENVTAFIENTVAILQKIDKVHS